MSLSDLYRKLHNKNWRNSSRKKLHQIPLCLVKLSHSNLVFVEERPDLRTPLQKTNEQTLRAFPSVELPKICWTVKYICALPSACWLKKIHETKSEIDKENTKLQIVGKFQCNLYFFRILNDRYDKLHNLWKSWDILQNQIEENQRQSQVIPALVEP